MFLEVKEGDRVYEDYYRKRAGTCKGVTKGPKGGIYCTVLWDDGVLAPKVNARNIRATEEREPLSSQDPGGEFYLKVSETQLLCKALRHFRDGSDADELERLRVDDLLELLQP